FFIWVIKNKLTKEFREYIQAQPKFFTIFFILFFLSGIISTFVSPDLRKATGQFLVLFLMPMLVYFPAGFILANPINKIRFVKIIFLAVSVVSIYGIIQYFTLIGLPSQWWGNANEPKRILSFFEYPNAFALYLAPLLAFLLPFVRQGALKNRVYKASYGLGLIALLLTLSRGGWLGFLVALGVYILFFAEKKERLAALTGFFVATLIVLATPNLRYRVILPFMGEKSTVSRFSLWQTADKMINDSPILGKGLYGFKSNYDKYNSDPNLPSINYPHNIFLNFWVETGALGLISFLGLSYFFVTKAIKRKGLLSIATILFLTALYFHGLADAPYFKNDLALIFWILLSL
ncbi:MAG: O-antigen ligase family protein, partial [Patescibacteria group bacterium]